MVNEGVLVCTQCGFTYAEFLARGLLGCPRCYAQFGEALWADLLQIHPHLHRRPFPGIPADGSDAGAADRELEDKAGLQEKLMDALRRERYEEAAEIRRKLDQGKETRGNH